MREGDPGRDEARHEPEPGCGGEAAGQAAADCAAVCCCCPMALLEVLLLVAVRLPADLLRRARLRRRRRRRLRRSGGRGGDASLSGSAKAMIAAVDAREADEAAAGARRAKAEVEAASELEREIMASRLYGAGFWRSASSRSSSCASSARRP